MNESSRENSGFYGWLSRKRVLWLFAVLASVSQVSILAILRSGIDPLDLLLVQTTLSKAAFLDIVSGWGEPGWRAFYRHYWVDFLHPCLYGIFLASAIANLLRRRGALGGIARYLVFLPLVAGACDEIENVCQLFLARSLPEFATAPFVAGALAADVKWTIVAISIATIAVLSVRGSRSRLEARN